MEYGLKDEYLEELHSIIKRLPDIEEVILYGSRARGDYGVGSDIDICLKGKNITSTDIVNLKNYLYESRIPYFFDISIWHDLKNEDFKNNIAKDGKIIYKAHC